MHWLRKFLRLQIPAAMTSTHASLHALVCVRFIALLSLHVPMFICPFYGREILILKFCLPSGFKLGTRKEVPHRADTTI